MKLGNLMAALPIFQKLANEKFTIKTLYKLNKLISRLDKEFQFYSNERIKIIEEFGQKRTETEYYIPEENKEIVNNKLKELADIEVEPPIECVKIPISEEISLSCNELHTLEGLIELQE